MTYTLSHAIHDLHARFDLPPATLDVAQDLRDIAKNWELVARRRVMAGWYGDAIDHYLDAVRRAALALSWCDGCGEVILDVQHNTDDAICGNGDGPGFFLHATCGAIVDARSDKDRREIYRSGRHRADSLRQWMRQQLEETSR